MHQIVRELQLRSELGETDIAKPERDAEEARDWLGRIFLLFRAFDFKEVEDKSRFLPELEPEEQRRDDAKLEETRAEQQRGLSQKKSLLMEIEDVSAIS